MRLYKLIGLEILALEREYKETLKKIKEYTGILKDKGTMDQVIMDDLDRIKEEFALLRRTDIEDGKEAFYEEAPMEVQEVTFVMDRFGYCKVLDKTTFERNRETVETEYPQVIRCMNTDKICLFTDKGNLHQIKVKDIPGAKLREKGVPVDNLSKFDGTKEVILCLTSLDAIMGRKLIFATKMALVKQVPGEEFITNNRTVAATKLQDGDELVNVTVAGQQTEVVIQTKNGVFLRFPLVEISEMKKNSRGVRGIKLEKDDELEALYLIGDNPVVQYKKKEVHLNRLKIGKRDGKGSKVRG